MQGKYEPIINHMYHFWLFKMEKKKKQDFFFHIQHTTYYAILFYLWWHYDLIMNPSGSGTTNQTNYKNFTLQDSQAQNNGWWLELLKCASFELTIPANTNKASILQKDFVIKVVPIK